MCYLANVELTFSFVEGEKKNKNPNTALRARRNSVANTENK